MVEKYIKVKMALKKEVGVALSYLGTMLCVIKTELTKTKK